MSLPDVVSTGNRALFTLSEFATLPGTSDVLEKEERSVSGNKYE